jgi:DHHC palmitoyltransferase
MIHSITFTLQAALFLIDSQYLVFVLSIAIGLNTCVGKANYQQFFRTMLSLFFMELVHFVIQLALLIDIFSNGSTKQLADEWLGMGYQAILSVLAFFLAFNALSMFLLGQLIMLHTSLQRKKLTTYEFIVIDSKRKRELAKLKGDLERQRRNELDYASQNKHVFRSFRLSCGGFCRNKLHCAVMDPLDLPKPYEPDPEAGFGTVLGENKALPTKYNQNERTTSDMTTQEQQQTTNDDNKTSSSHNLTLTTTGATSIRQSGSNTSNGSSRNKKADIVETHSKESVGGREEAICPTIQEKQESSHPPIIAASISKEFDEDEDGIEPGENEHPATETPLLTPDYHFQ